MNPIHQVRDWAKDIVDLALILIAFGVVVYIIFGPESGWYFSSSFQIQLDDIAIQPKKRGGGGRITIEYYNNEDLERLIGALRGDE